MFSIETVFQDAPALTINLEVRNEDGYVIFCIQQNNKLLHR